MARTLSEAAITTRNARSKLDEGVHWRGIDTDVHLGYRRGKRSGRWLVRWYGGSGKYRQEGLGSADDVIEADGRDCLTFDQAKAKAVVLVRQRRAEDIASADGPAPTVRSAVETYLTARETREAERRGTMREKNDARLRLTKHVLRNPLGDMALHVVTEMDLENWRESVSRSVASATVQRLVNDLKAALNAAATRHRAKLPAEFAGMIKAGLKASEATAPKARDDQALSDAEVRRILDMAQAVDTDDGWDGDLFRMVVVLAATGARFSQIARMNVGDVQASKGRLMVPVSMKGKGRKGSSHIAVRVGDDVLSELRPALAGRRSAEPLLMRWRHKQLKGDETSPPRWVRDERGPWRTSVEITRPWRRIADRAGLPLEVVPYALRHSSIVRQLRLNLPVRLVAALHDTSAAMIEAHYSAFIVDALDALAAGAVIPLVSTNEEKVVKLRG